MCGVEFAFGSPPSSRHEEELNRVGHCLPPEIFGGFGTRPNRFGGRCAGFRTLKTIESRPGAVPVDRETLPPVTECPRGCGMIRRVSARAPPAILRRRLLVVGYSNVTRPILPAHNTNALAPPYKYDSPATSLK